MCTGAVGKLLHRYFCGTLTLHQVMKTTQAGVSSIHLDHTGGIHDLIAHSLALLSSKLKSLCVFLSKDVQV